jgi:signal transduction histidine kinase
MRTDLNSLVREAIDTMRAQADSRGVAINFDAGPSAVLQADGREMLRVLVNLLSNAIDACDREGGRVDLSVLRDDSGLTVVVKDNGAGIPEQVLPRIFDAFYSTKGSRGTGLGLACCEKIVAQHGGRIDVQSKPGEGATFYVFLPFERKDGKATQSLTIVQRGIL